MAETVVSLNEQQFTAMRKEKFVLLNTIDAELETPVVSAISWIYAVSPTKLRFALDRRSRMVANLQANPQGVVTYIGFGTVNAIYGKAEVAAEFLEGVPFKMTCYDFHIDAVRDAMFYGARITVDPEYEKTYDKRAAQKLDDQVFSAMEKLEA